MFDETLEASEVTAELAAFARAVVTISFALDGTILRANDQFLRLFGYEAREIVGREHAIFLPDDERAGAEAAAMWQRLLQGESCEQAFFRVRKDGAGIWIRGTYVPVLDAAGRPAKVMAFATDITAERSRILEDEGQIAAINAAQAVIHFALDGTILHANDLFLATLGYRLDEVVGRHHRIFVEPSDADSADYGMFWNDLAAGRSKTAEFKRIGKGGRELWLQATYNPVLGLDGRPSKIIKYATDVTRERLLHADYRGQIAAIHKSQCVIEFDTDGTTINANDRFLDAMGYRFEEIDGRHHRMFVDPSHAHSAEYSNFWSDLARGVHQAGEYKRYDKHGREVWLQATYNPVCDLNGKPFKIVKFATIVTKEKLHQADYQGQIAAIHKAQCVIAFAIDGTIIDANDNFLAATGYRLSEVRRKHHRMFVDPVEAQSAEYAAFWSDLAAGRYRSGDYKRLTRDGREIWLQATYNPIFDINGRPFKVVKYATDVTREKLLHADHRGQIAAIDKSQCVIAFAMDGTILEANENFLAAIGYSLEEIKGRPHRIFVPQGLADGPDYANFWEELRAGKFQSGMYKRIGRGGKEVWIQASYNPIFDLNGRPFKVIKFATDVTADVALAEALSQAKQQALHDAATALPNRVRLASFMTNALAEPEARLAVLYMDLDRFKPINDRYGHHVGDYVLGEVANRLRRALPDDQLVARVGGDEFVVAAPNLSEDEVEALSQRLIAIVTAPIIHEKGELSVGLSIGVALSPDDATTADALLQCADVALYRSKGSGRGTYSFHSKAMSDRMAAFRHLAADMRRGIEAEEFFLEYQPRFDSATRSVQSVEALVRWAHPERGRIPPLDFIPLAEKSGLIGQLGEWVLRTACRQAVSWPGVGISVNVSPVQFRDGTLVDIVGRVLAETGLTAEQLELEITEGVLMENAERAHVALDGLKALGVKLAMDDFGTGYSSLSYLRNFPFDVIKIDRQFIADMEEHEGGRPIVQAILGLGKALGLSVTAEGVETTGQLMLLTLDSCPEVQGYLLARPMSAAAISELLAKERWQLSAAE